MIRRVLFALTISVMFILGIVFAFRIAAADGAELLFDSGWWVVALAPFVGVFAAGFTKRVDPHVEGDKVLRHDGAAILEHWTHGVGTAVLLVSGIMLGLFFVPALVSGGSQIWALMNVHFVAVILFLFGTFYYAANTVLSSKRFGEHLPTRNAFSFTVAHYGHLLGVKSCEMPPEDKYYESEKMAYILALGATATIVVTGLFKVAAHVIDLPGWWMGPMTLLHDVATVAMLAFFVAHVFFAAIAPFSWPVLGSMFTGYVSKSQVQKEHAGWWKRLTTDTDASK